MSAIRGGAKSEPLVELRGVTKHFQAVIALSDVTLTIRRGAIHALVGENGAGKSTLGKIVAGVLHVDAGELLIGGEVAHYRSPRDALRAGIVIVQQEVALVPHLAAIDNVFLGIKGKRAGLLDKKGRRVQFGKLCQRSGFDLPPDALVSRLRVAEQQQVEILRALARDARLIVLDEPTASLTRRETANLFRVIHQLRDQGTTIIFVSHHLDEVLEIADTVTVLRNGNLVRTAPTSEETEQSLVTAMLGRPAELTFPSKTAPSGEASVAFAVRGLTRRGVIENISFAIQKGEILGLAGLVGSGRSEVVRAIFGADRRDAGEIEVNGRDVSVGSPKKAVRAGIVLLPESRKDQGLLLRKPLATNVTLPHLREVSKGNVIALRREFARTQGVLQRLAVKPPNPRARVDSLSGGNQQKVLFGKWLFEEPRVFLADEPTRGVDVGAKLAIYELLTGLAARGMAVLLISSEIEEIVGLAHRALVMWRGRIVAEFQGPSLTMDNVMRAAFGQEMSAVGM